MKSQYYSFVESHLQYGIVLRVHINSLEILKKKLNMSTKHTYPSKKLYKERQIIDL